MRKHPFIFIYFTLTLFIMYESGGYFLTASKALPASVQESIIYGVSYLASAGGVLLFAVFKRYKTKPIKVFVLQAFILSAVTICVSGLLPAYGVFWVMLIIFNLMQGLNIAVCANYLYRLIQSGIKIGITLASAAVAGLALNFATDSVFPAQTAPVMIILSAAILILLYLAFQKISLAGLFGSREKDEADTGEGRKRFLPVFWTVAIAIIVMSYMIGVNDIAIFTTLLSDPAQSLFIPQALLYIPGLFIAGLLADVREGKYLPLVTLACTLLTTPVVTHINSPEVFTQYSGITYFLGGFYLVFIITNLITLARRGRNPIIIISACTSLYFLFLSVGAFTSSLYFQADSMIALSVFIGLVAVLLLIFYLSGHLHQKAALPGQESLYGQNNEMIESRMKSFSLTKRESEVLLYLLDGQSTHAIAGKMFVTENTVQKYIGNMMAKCDTKSRTELITKFTKQTI